MKTNTIKTITLLSLLGSFTVASAGILPAFSHDENHCRRDEGRHCMSAPEIDPGSAMGALALLGGTVAILRGRRKK